MIKVVVGLAGILVAFILSVIASGWDVEGTPYTVSLESNISKRVFELLNITLDRPYKNVTLKISNTGVGGLSVTLGVKRLELDPGGLGYIRVDNLLETISFNFESRLGRAEVTVYTTWREGVNPFISVIAIVILVPSMILAGYGIIEHVILRRF